LLRDGGKSKSLFAESIWVRRADGGSTVSGFIVARLLAFGIMVALKRAVVAAPPLAVRRELVGAAGTPSLYEVY
jgi:hypothetical protein